MSTTNNTMSASPKMTTCDCCKNDYDITDLTDHHGEWLCSDCEEQLGVKEEEEEEEEVCSNPKCSGRNYGEVKNGFCNNCRPCECGKCDVVGGSCEVEDEDDEHECDEDDSEKMRK